MISALVLALVLAAPADSLARGTGAPAADSLARFAPVRADTALRNPALRADSLAGRGPASADTLRGRLAPPPRIISGRGIRPDTSAVRPAPPPVTIVGRPAPGAPTPPADTLAQRAAASLAGLAGVELVVEPLSPEAAAAVPLASVRSRVQSLLLRSGVRVLTKTELAADRRAPVLGVSVALARPIGPALQSAYLARLALWQWVLEIAPGSGAAQARISAGTWSAERLGSAYRTALRDSVMVGLDALAGAFARDWRRQNPK